jgi:hypothetical protein
MTEEKSPRTPLAWPEVIITAIVCGTSLGMLALIVWAIK